MLKNKTIFIAIISLAVIGGVSTVIFLDESVSDGVEIENTKNMMETTLGSSHFAGGGIPDPNFTFEMPSEINVGQTVSITYTINWNDEDGNLLHPSLFKKGYLDDVVITPVLYLPDEIKIITEEFDLRAALGTSYNTHMLGKYYGEGIPYDNTQIFEGTIKIKLLEPMFYDHDDIHFLLDKASDVFSFQTVLTDEGIVIVTQSDPRSDGFRHHEGIKDRYLEVYSFDKEDQDWYGYDGIILDVTPTGFPQNVLSQRAPPMDGPIEPTYMPREGWADFAYWLKDRENAGEFEVNREFFLSQNMSEQWIQDFFEAYPEFLIEDTDFNYFILPEAHAATNNFYVYGHYKVDGHEGYEKGGDNVIICAYDVNSEGYDETILQNGSSDVCKNITSPSGYFSLYGINSDSENSLMDLKFGIKMKNNDVEIKGTNNIDDSIESTTFFENAEHTRYNVATYFFYVGDVGPQENHVLPYYYLDLTTQLHTDLESKVNYDTPKVDIVFSPFVFRDIEYLHGGSDHNFIENTISYHSLTNNVVDNFQYSSILAHEYGHHVHHTYYNDNQNSVIPPCTVNNHSFDDFLTAECGWSEGFAWFFAAWLLDDSTINITSSTDTPRVVDLENTTIDGTPFTQPPSSNGITNEGWVAAVLWDIYDDSSESGDDINNEITKLWTAFTDDKEPGETYPASSILNFKDDWDDNGYPSLDSLFSLNNLSITNVPPTTGSTIFSDDFEGTLSQWTLTGDDEIWELRSGIPTGTTGNVASSDDCDKNCYMVSDTINTSQATTLTFDRYISTSIDTNEGLKVEVSTNNGRTWSELVFYSTTPRTDDSTWHTETFDVTSYQSSIFKIKFTGVSSSSSELVQIDDVTVTGSSGGTVPPPTTTSSLFEDNFNDLSNWSKSGDDRWHIVSTWREGMPPDGDSNNKIVVASNCDNPCILTSKTIDLSSHSSATLELLRFVDRSLDGGEYLSIEVFNGRVWTEIAKWGQDNSQDTDDWEFESFNISRYLDDNFKIKITSLQSSSSEDTGLDYIRIIT